MSTEKKEYYLGLDIGTESVGWCATDLEYRVLRLKGKSAWGVRLFNSAKTAAERRGFRTARRRLARRRQRVEWLRELLSAAVAKVDPNFFTRLDEARLHREDRSLTDGKYTLFADPNFTDKDYHKKYPTIYHLRLALMASPGHDIRLYYLAIAHMMKNRGHFLRKGEYSREGAFDDVFKELLAYVREELSLEFIVDSEDVKEIMTGSKGRKDKTNALKELLPVAKSEDDDRKIVAKRWSAAIDALAGKNVYASALLGLDGDAAKEMDNDKNKFSFGDGVSDETEEKLRGALAETFVFYEKLKAVYNAAVLDKLLKGRRSISDAQVAKYVKHRADLKNLKRIFRRYAPESYQQFFLESGKDSYAAYIGEYVNKVKTETLEQAAFCKSVRSKVEAIKNALEKQGDDHGDLKIVNEIINDCENVEFMPKPVSKANSVIPMQLHLMELDEILKNLGKDYPEFTVKDADGWSVCDKIRKTFEFRIPYYVGPLNTYHKKNSWMVRKAEGKIYPWNFEEKVDLEKCADAFMERLTSDCTYLYGETVLPKDSLLYSKYMVLNELHNVRLNGERLPVDIKQRIYHELFVDSPVKNLSLTKLKNKLIEWGKCSKDDELSGIDATFKASLKSYRDFRAIVGDVVDSAPGMVEEMIRWILVLGEEREMLRRTIREILAANGFSALAADEESVKQIANLQYSGWGKFSEKFLNGIAEDVGDGVQEGGRTILSAMWNGQENLMELLSDRHGFMEAVRAHNLATRGMAETELNYARVENAYASPAVKRGVWQALKIVDEIVRLIGYPPTRIFIEVAREKDKDPKRTKSRKDQLLELFKNIKDDERDWRQEIENTELGKFNGKKLFLYYLQEGRDIYDDSPIPLEELFAKNGAADVYDVDHVIPQKLKKDDSIFNNLVLTKHKLNHDKGYQYPVPYEYQTKARALWKRLRAHGLMSQEKFDRLTRTKGLTQQEREEYINRTLVETRQSTKLVAEILSERTPNVDIVYSKATRVSDFRQIYKFWKARSLNDFHHAKDAYLNIVVGAVWHTRFTQNARNFIKDVDANGGDYTVNLKKLLEHKVIRGETIAWLPDDDGTISQVRRQMGRNDILFTRMPTEKQEGFWDVMPLKNLANRPTSEKSEKKNVPEELKLARLKRDLDPTKYGGFDNLAINYFMLVESDALVKKGKTSKSKKQLSLLEEPNVKRQRSLEGIPVVLQGASDEELVNFLVAGLGLRNPEIVIPEIRIDSLLNYDGVPLHISGKTGDSLSVKNAVQLILDADYERIVHKIEKLLEKKNESKSKENSEISVDDLEKAALSLSDLDELYEALKEKSLRTCYKNQPAEQSATLEKGEIEFKNLSLDEKCRVLAEILKLFQCNAGKSDLTRIGGSKNAGAKSKRKFIPEDKPVFLIHQSVTGLCERDRVDLLNCPKQRREKRWAGEQY